VHTIVLPHATAYNRAGAPAAMARIARALDAEDAAAGLFDLAASLGVKQALSKIGLRESDLDRAADLATQSRYPNPARSPGTASVPSSTTRSTGAGRRLEVPATSATDMESYLLKHRNGAVAAKLGSG
jgi:alcohol dehydrogenase class IV